MGLPQGIILGPLLFILYCNDISNLFINSIDTKFILYADDTSITINNANNSKINDNLKYCQTGSLRGYDRTHAIPPFTCN